MVGRLLLTGALLLQQGPEITVGIRPQAVREGGRAVLSVRVLTTFGVPEIPEMVLPPGLVLEDVRERSSAAVGPGATAVLDREYHILAREAGEYLIPPIRVRVGAWVGEVRVPELSVAASPLHWPQREPDPARVAEREERRRDRVVEEGRPPSTGEMREARGGGAQAHGAWGYPGYLPGYSPQLPGMPGQGGGYLFGYPGTPYYSAPYGPNGGWPISPPGTTPGVGAPGWPNGYPGQGYWPGGSTGVPGGQWPGYPGASAGGFPGLYPGTADSTAAPPTLPPIPGGQWPQGMGGGWAETARGDPWWPELVPELQAYGATARSTGGEAGLSAGVTPQRIFVGQQATLVATATFAPGAFLGQGASPEYIPPSPPDFWAVDLPEPPLPLPTAAQGSVDQGYTFRRALFPTRPGEFAIPPAVLLLPGPEGVGNTQGWDTLRTGSLPVSVLPVPRTTGIPGYAGAVGRYRLEAGITPTRLAVGEAALLVVRILGVGNVRDIPALEVGPLLGAELAPGGDGAVVEVQDGVVGGVRTFTWLVVPTEPGPLRIDPIPFAYFDPYLGDFGQVASPELLLEVTEFPGGER